MLFFRKKEATVPIQWRNVMQTQKRPALVHWVAGLYFGTLFVTSVIATNDRMNGPFHEEMRPIADPIIMVFTAIARPEKFEQIMKERARSAP